jgi:hypothetical protein
LENQLLAAAALRNEGKAEEARILLLKLYEQNGNDAEH